MSKKTRLIVLVVSLVAGLFVAVPHSPTTPAKAASVETSALFKIDSAEKETTPIGCISCPSYKTTIPIFAEQTDLAATIASATKIDTFNSSAWDQATQQQKTYKGGCALIAGGMKCWGDNSRGQLGDETTTNSLDVPVVAKENGVPLTGVTDVATNGVTTCVVASGVLKCVGAGNWEGNYSKRYWTYVTSRNRKTDGTETDYGQVNTNILKVYNSADVLIYSKEDTNWIPDTMTSKTWVTFSGLGSDVQKVQVGNNNGSTPTLCVLKTTGKANCAVVTAGTSTSFSDSLTQSKSDADCDGVTTDGVKYEVTTTWWCDASLLGDRNNWDWRQFGGNATLTSAATWSWVDAGVTGAIDIAMPSDSWGAATICFAGATTICRPFSAGEFGKAVTVENGENSQAVYITAGWGAPGLCLYSNNTISCGAGTWAQSGYEMAKKVIPVAVMAKPLNIFFSTTSTFQKLYFLVPSGILAADAWILTCSTCSSGTSGNFVSPVTAFSSSTATTFSYAKSVNGSTDNSDYVPMTVVTGTRKMRSSVSMTVKTESGEALTGVSVRWVAPDAPDTLSSSASSTLATDGAGAARSTLPSGPVTFTLSPPTTTSTPYMGPVTYPGGPTTTTSTLPAGTLPTTGGTLASGASLQAASITAVVGDTGAVTITVPDPPTVVKRKITVELPDGTPVPSATVQFKNTYLTYAYQNSGSSTSTWSSRAKDSKGFLQQMSCAYCFVAPPRYATGSDGSVTIQSFDPTSRSSSYDADVAYDDGELNQNVKKTFSSLTETVRMPFMASIKATLPDADPSTPTKDTDTDPSTPEPDLKPDSNGAVSVETSVSDEDDVAISGQPESVETVNSGCDSGGLVSSSAKVDTVCTEGSVATASLGKAAAVRANGIRSLASCTPTLSSTTNAAGKATLTVCPTVSTKYRIRGKGAVATRTFCVVVNGVKCGAATQTVNTGTPTGGTPTNTVPPSSYTPPSWSNPSTSNTSSTPTVKRSSKTALSKLLAPEKGATATYSVSSACKVSGKYLIAAKKTAVCKLVMTQSKKTKVNGKWVIKKTRKTLSIKIT